MRVTGSRRWVLVGASWVALVLVPGAALAAWNTQGSGAAYVRAGTWATTCTPGSVTVVAEADVYARELSPTTNIGLETFVRVRSNAGNRKYPFLRFPDPGVPAGCSTDTVTLRLFKENGNVGTPRTLTVDAVTAPWQEGTNLGSCPADPNDPCGLTWANMSALTFGATTVLWSLPGSGPGSETLDVTALGFSADGYRIRDGIDDTPLNFELNFRSRENTTVGTDPELVVTYS